MHYTTFENFLKLELLGTRNGLIFRIFKIIDIWGSRRK